MLTGAKMHSVHLRVPVSAARPSLPTSVDALSQAEPKRCTATTTCAGSPDVLWGGSRRAWGGLNTVLCRWRRRLVWCRGVGGGYNERECEVEVAVWWCGGGAVGTRDRARLTHSRHSPAPPPSLPLASTLPLSPHHSLFLPLSMHSSHIFHDQSPRSNVSLAIPA